MVEQLRERWPLVLWALLLCGAVALAFPHAMSTLYLEAGGRAMDEPAQAVAHLQKAIAWDGANSQAYRLLAQAYLALGQPDAAIDALTQASALRPENPLLHMELAQIYEAQGQAPGEDPDLDRQAAREWVLAGLNVDKLLDQGEKYRQEGFPDGALVWYERAMRLEPDLGDPWYYVGLLREDQGDYEGALAAYERAASAERLLTIGHSDSLYRQGVIYRWRLTSPAVTHAVEAFKAAVQSNDFSNSHDAAHCYYLYGFSLRETHVDPDEYIAAFSRATEISPRHAMAHAMLGVSLYEREQDLAVAEAELLKAIRLAPEEPWSHFYLGQIYHTEGMLDLARGMFEEALKLNPSFAAAQQALESLDRDG